jgi:glycosyltransferase involved in cell wall biosynthesis
MKENRWHISVLIPARDEEDLLPRCLRSVLAACRALERKVTWDVVIAVDRSKDRTLAIAQDLLGTDGSVIQVDAGVVGVARATAAKVALLRQPPHTARVWLANTDADCSVPANWLSEQLRMAKLGVEAVAGIVDVDSFKEHDSCVPQRFRSTYLVHPDGTHPHVHGANLGVHADAYLRAGGWAALSTGEDHDLWGRLRSCGARTFSSSHLRVVTSGRRVGRAPLGFAGALAAHNEVTVEA